MQKCGVGSISWEVGYKVPCSSSEFLAKFLSLSTLSTLGSRSVCFDRESSRRASFDIPRRLIVVASSLNIRHHISATRLWSTPTNTDGNQSSHRPISTADSCRSSFSELMGSCSTGNRARSTPLSRWAFREPETRHPQHLTPPFLQPSHRLRESFTGTCNGTILTPILSERPHASQGWMQIAHDITPSAKWSGRSNFDLSFMQFCDSLTARNSAAATNARID